MVTLMWFFASVGQHMRCQAAFLVEGFIAHVALKWRLSGVNPYMPLQITTPSETYMADFTLVCFFTRMDKRVSLESECSGERPTYLEFEKIYFTHDAGCKRNRELY